LAGTGQHQSWQIEATNLCFLHANAISELVELGKQSASIEWPAFVGYCICTAGTVHVHGAHYKGGREGEVFSASTDYLSREMQRLSELRYSWASVQHQRETLQTIYGCHAELVKSLGSNPMRFSPVFHLEDFFDRYSTLGQAFDGAHISFADVMMDPTLETYTGHDLYAPRVGTGTGSEDVGLSNRKASSSRKRHGSGSAHVSSHVDNDNPIMSPVGLLNDLSQQPPQGSHLLLSHDAPQQHQPLMNDTSLMNSFATPRIPTLSTTPFSPPYNFSNVNLSNQQESFDPMFGMSQISQGIASGGFSYEQVMTPGGRSNNSAGTSGEEKDPFLSLLEQLAENEHSRGGPSELDYFLTGQGQ